MSSDFLLYPAIFVFLMLIVGLVLTVLEFSKMQKDNKKSKLIDK
jgi:hypothetical protein